MNAIKKTEENIEEQTTAFPVPFSLESFRTDIMEVYLHYVRTVGRMIIGRKDVQTRLLLIWSLTGMPKPEMNDEYQLFNPELDANTLGLRYEHIQDSMIAHYMESLYQFAFYGRRDPSEESMEQEGTYMGVTDLVRDAFESHTSEEWDSNGGRVISEAKNCLLVAETANARCILEDGKYFSYYASGKDKDLFPEEDSLTIRQMALLSGMEEMSIRSAANPKRANPLITFKGEKGSTRITRDVAKEWLIQKGRYVPVTLYSSSAELNLAKQKFTRFENLESALENQAIVIVSKLGEDIVRNKLEEMGIWNNPVFSFNGNFIKMNESDCSNEPLIRKIAEFLELPPDLLVLRCKQTAANEQLTLVERQLREVVGTDRL